MSNQVKGKLNTNTVSLRELDLLLFTFYSTNLIRIISLFCITSEDETETFEDAREVLSPIKGDFILSSSNNASPIKELKNTDCITSSQGNGMSQN
jgi:hypothetical protein